MSRTARILCWAYLLGATLATYCATTSAQHSAPGYAAGLGTVAALLVTATVRELLAAGERSLATINAERARAHKYDSAKGVARVALAAACCERWWTSAGAEHDTEHCTRKDQTA
ncbi:hypothetical protein [Streptomyces sp. NPDC057302]|uniref:hypothetical protein n=1 Tax=Streptomyces sp. NPDC057302 TaxID=3346094 RepID=UPI003643876E